MFASLNKINVIYFKTIVITTIYRVLVLQSWKLRKNKGYGIVDNVFKTTNVLLM